MENNKSSHKREKRVEYHFILRVRPVSSSHETVWDVSTVRNISRTGVLFYSSQYYDYNSEIEMRIKNPIISEEIKCVGRVMRCSLLEKMKGVYSIGIEITSVDEAGKDAFDKTIKIFMDKQK